jgi:hypothetical protein
MGLALRASSTMGAEITGRKSSSRSHAMGHFAHCHIAGCIEQESENTATMRPKERRSQHPDWLSFKRSIQSKD